MGTDFGRAGEGRFKVFGPRLQRNLQPCYATSAAASSWSVCLRIQHIGFRLLLLITKPRTVEQSDSAAVNATLKETGALTTILKAIHFAAQKHCIQRRRDELTPYINHPIAVAEVLARVGKVTDLPTLEAAVLHDTIEDTDTTAEELDVGFGSEVRVLVLEVTDNKQLPKQERKRLQIEGASGLSSRAKQIKIADKICNLGDITLSQPPDWPLERKRGYLDWAEKVVAGCRGCNLFLEQHFESVLTEKRTLLATGP